MAARLSFSPDDAGIRGYTRVHIRIICRDYLGVMERKTQTAGG